MTIKKKLLLQETVQLCKLQYNLTLGLSINSSRLKNELNFRCFGCFNFWHRLKPKSETKAKSK